MAGCSRGTAAVAVTVATAHECGFTLHGWNLRNTGPDAAVVRLRKNTAGGAILQTISLAIAESSGSEPELHLDGADVFVELVSGTSVEGVLLAH